MRQKLTRIIQAEPATSREIAVSPAITKRERLAAVWRANAKKAWATRKRMKQAREAARAAAEAEANVGEGQKAA